MTSKLIVTFISAAALGGCASTPGQQGKMHGKMHDEMHQKMREKHAAPQAIPAQAPAAEEEHKH